MNEKPPLLADRLSGGSRSLKKTKVVLDMMPDAELDLPYEGGSEMVLVDTDDRDFIREVVLAMYDEIPAPKKRKK